jgi:putative FmdB family regulatory protein
VPTYAYTCKDCGYRFEQHQSFSDAALTQCPRCDGHLRKLFNSVGVVFKGSGFYRTDSRSDGKRSSSLAPSGEKTHAASEAKAPATSSTSKDKAAAAA